MTVAYWCVLIAAIMPLLGSTVAKAGAAGFDNRSVRPFLESQQGWRLRANWAQQNAYEAFPPFAAAVIIAHLTGGAAQATIDGWALAFVALRTLYMAMYILNAATLRSLVWTAAFACIIGLFVSAA
ncbi:MAG: MAPEG family protein [Pseudomonadota bacterium]|nr:MAPEG family protein [Pseudomonadota bacterium]